MSLEILEHCVYVEDCEEWARAAARRLRVAHLRGSPLVIRLLSRVRMYLPQLAACTAIVGSPKNGSPVSVTISQSSSMRRCWRTWAAVSCRVGRRCEAGREG